MASFDKSRSSQLFGSFLLLIMGTGLLRSLAQTGTEPRKPAVRASKELTKLSFNETIQPILSENCYACHGPDPGARKAGLRLDRGEFAFAPHQDAHEKYPPAIIPGNAEKSPLVRRIETKNPKDRMPPPEAHKTLKPEQIALLREWVKEGAEYEEHWSFLAPKAQAVPVVKQAGWVRNAIDNFILARLEKEGLTPSPEADRR